MKQKLTSLRNVLCVVEYSKSGECVDRANQTFILDDKSSTPCLHVTYYFVTSWNTSALPPILTPDSDSRFRGVGKEIKEKFMGDGWIDPNCSHNADDSDSGSKARATAVLQQM